VALAVVVSNAFPLGSMVLCAVPTFLTLAQRQPATIAFQGAKIQKISQPAVLVLKNSLHNEVPRSTPFRSE